MECVNQVVIKPSVAKKLLNMGFQIVDIRPQKQTDGTVDYTRSVFIFQGKEGLSNVIKVLTSK